MVFMIENQERRTTDILSFIFSDGKSEHEFKLAMAVKLFEHNQQSSFAKLVKVKLFFFLDWLS